MARIITVAAVKGGVGKSTTAINLASLLAQKNYKVLLIDSDFQGNSSKILTGEKWVKKTNFYMFLKNWSLDKDVSIPAENYFSDSILPNLKVVASSRNADDVPELLVQLAKENPGIGVLEILDDRLYEFRDNFDFIIIDTPPSNNDTVKSALLTCDYVLVPCTYTMEAIDGMEATLDQCTLLQKQEDCFIKVLGIVGTMVKERTNATKEYREDVSKNRYGERLLATEIHQSQEVVNASKNLLPIVLYNPTSKPAQEYMKLCDEILDLIFEDERQMRLQEGNN